jgi:uncharacterized protein (DUF488 family)
VKEQTTLFTIGHSNIPLTDFLKLLEYYEIDVLIDVRSSPYSRVAPHFGREPLKRSLAEERIAYVFAGKELGGRPPEMDHYSDDGHVLYWRLAENPRFLLGIERVVDVARQRRAVVMCSEEDPAGCHRHLLIARVLEGSGVDATHIRGDSTLQPYDVMADVRKRRAGELTLFPGEQDETWRSIRSVLPSAPLRASSKH